MRLPRTLTAAAVAFCTVAGAVAVGDASGPATAASAAAPQAAVPNGAAPVGVDLSRRGSGAPIATGAEAARWLDEAPPEVRREVADNAGREPEELTRLFLEDDTAFLAPDGMVGYIDPVPSAGVEDLPADTAGAGAVESSTPVEAFGATPADVFTLHSLPSSTKVIYLDFDGHVMQSEYWNSRFSIGPYTNNAYDIDGNPAAFSSTERDRIYEIFQRVADDYAPFDIDVTTEYPGVDGLRRTSGGDTTYGVRVVITSSDWYAAANGGARIGGIALLDVFTSSTDHAAYVFSGNLGSGNAKYVADAASHEAGHTLSLHHDGTSTDGYYRGHGSWGPIMGAPYSRSVTQWSDGQYPNADNTTEDDLAAIGARGGLRTDDHGNATANATAATVGTREGVIGVGDVDVFRFTPTGNDTRVSVSTPPPGTNLLARLTVRDADGGIVTQVEPSVASGWSLTTDVPASAGSFTVEVAPSSWLTPSTGFVAYGSLGAYTISFTDLPGTTSTTSTTSTTTSTTSTSSSLPPPSTTTSTTTSSTSTTTTSTTAPTTSAPPTTAPPTTAPRTTVPPAATPTSNGLALTAIAPQRLVDTRVGLGGRTRPPAGGIVRVPIAGRAGVPADARAVVANITLVEPAAAGFATLFPCTASVPDVSVLNHASGQTVANNAIATLSARGELCVYTYAAADVLVDVTGWLGPTGTSRMVPIGPTRVVDTRSGLGGSRRVTAGSTTRFDLRAALPPQSTAVAVNLTVVTPSAAGYVTAYPCARGRPATSSLNFAAAETRANNAVVATDNGAICVYADTAADILVDVTAAFGPNGLGLVPVDPVRLLDTRRTSPFGQGEIRPYSTLGSRAAPLTPRSASVNVTALDQPAAGFVTTFDCITLRDTSTLNPDIGRVSANGAIVPVRNGDQSCLRSSTGGNLIVDLNGWWVP